LFGGPASSFLSYVHIQMRIANNEQVQLVDIQQAKYTGRQNFAERLADRSALFLQGGERVLVLDKSSQ
jgi:hypothetical protein